MKVVLFSMPDTVPKLFSRKWRCPSMGLASLAGNVTDYELTVADLILKLGDVPGAVRQVIEDVRPQVVGLTAMSFQFATALKIINLVKELDPDIKIVVGGYHSTLLSGEISQDDECRNIDFFVRGEGDVTFNELLHAIDGKLPFEKVLGLSYKANGAFVHNPPRPLADLSAIRIPARTKRFWTDYTYYDKTLDVSETSRGCTLKCNFCSITRMYGTTFRTYAVERVIDDLKSVRDVGGDYVLFADDNITLDVERFKTICDAIVKSGLNDKMRFVTQASCLGIAKDEELSRKMAEAGFDIVFLGIENVSTRNLRAMKKANSLDHITRAIDYLHKYNIMIIGGMIVGLPEDREQDIRENFEFFRNHDVDFIGDQVVTPYPKTVLREEMLQAGQVTNLDDFRKYNGFWANVRTNHLEPEEIQFAKWKLEREFSTFYHPSAIFKKKYPLAHLYRILCQIPFRKAQQFLRSIGQSEKEEFRRELHYYEHMNDFFENTH